MTLLPFRFSPAVCALVLLVLPSPAEQPAGQPPRLRDAGKVHDPSPVITRDGVARIFSTGPGVSLLREEAGKWTREGQIFPDGKLPAWHDARVPGNRGYLWAPDVREVDGRFYVYYSVSTFGKNQSAIGLAVGRSVDPASPDWQWEDRGPVIASQPGDRFNAIDPAVFCDAADGRWWMAFGSFWDGIHLVELDPATGGLRHAGAVPQRIAAAEEIEAPFLCRHGEFFYLLFNVGKCCRGVDSTYEIRAGRSRTMAGPWRDRAGVDLLAGGGTPVLATDGRWVGPGHASITVRDGREWLVHHIYDRELAGRSRLRMVPLSWDAEGWPVTAPAQ